MASTYSEATSGTLDFYNQAVQDLFAAGKTAYDNTLTQTPIQQQVAGLDPLQLQAIQNAQGNVGNWSPTIQGGIGATQGALGAIQYDPNQLQQFLNPYTSGVVDEIARLGNKNLNENILPTLQGQFGGLGQSGSARSALAAGKASADTGANILGQQANALSDSYNSAMDVYSNWAKNQADVGLTAGTNLNNLGTTQSQLGVVDYGTLFNAGQALQTQAQTELNTATQNAQTAQNYPWQALNSWQSVFGVNTPQQSTSWSTQLKDGGLVARAANGGGMGDWELVSARPGQVFPSERPPELQREENPHLQMLRQLYGEVDDRLAAPARSTNLNKLARSALRAAASDRMGLGEQLGVAGEHFYGIEDAERDAIRANEGTRLGFKEKLLDQIKKTGSGAAGGLKLYRGKDGSQWGVDPTTHERHLLLPGSYDSEINKLAMDAAKKSIDDEGLSFNNEAQRAAVLNERFNQFRNSLRSKYATIGDATVSAGPAPGGMPPSSPMPSQGGAMPPPARLPAPSAPGMPPSGVGSDPQVGGVGPAQGKGGSSLPEGKFIGSFEAVQKEIQAIKDPLERNRAMAAFERQYLGDPPLYTVGKIAEDEAGVIVPPAVRKSREYAETQAQKSYQEEFIPAIESATRLADMNKQLLALDLPLGKFADVKQVLGSWAEALGFDSKFVDDAEKLQSARPLLKEAQNAILIAAKGVQTEGDAQRAMEQFIKLDDTPGAAKQIARISAATAYLADLAGKYSQDYASANKDQLRGMRTSWNSYRRKNLPMFRVNPNTGKPVYINEWVDLVKENGGSEGQALQDWAKLKG